MMVALDTAQLGHPLKAIELYQQALELAEEAGTWKPRVESLAT